MAEIRDFNRSQYLLKGEKNKKIKEKETANSKIKDKSMDNMLARHRQIKLYMVLAVLGFAAIVALSSYISWKHKVYVGYDVIRESEWVRAKDSKTIHLKGTLLTYSNDGISCTNLKGKTIWNQTYEMQNPMIKTSGKQLQLAITMAEKFMSVIHRDRLGQSRQQCQLEIFASLLTV